MAKKFPEDPRGDMGPATNDFQSSKRSSSEHFHKSSQQVGHGHTDHSHRMPHPQRDGFKPNDETGEGQ